MDVVRVRRVVIFPLKPRELKIEITDVCDLRCTFCYLGKKVHQGRSFMTEDEVLKWIDWATDNAVPGVRFTGGEATLHPLIEMFCCYARLRGRYVILNTNGMSNEKLYQRLFRVVDDVRVSLPTLDATDLDRLAGGTGCLAKKQRVIGMALEIGVARVCILTPLLPDLHGSLEGFVRFAQISPRLFWLPLRYESTPTLPRPWSCEDTQAFAEEMADLMDRFPEQAEGIFLATPFCSVTPVELGARVFHGRTEDCGPFVALNVGLGGCMEACFGVAKMEDTRSLLELGECREMKVCTSSEALPTECNCCQYVARCAGGCRKPYALVEHDGRWIDYLAGFLS